MKIIGLTRGQYALIDDKDFALISRYKWYAVLDHNKKYYAVASIHGTNILMHRMLLGVYNSAVHVDHKSGNTLDNRRQNIRKATQSQNSCNKGKISKANRYKGVRKVYTKKDGRNKYLGYIQHNGQMFTKQFDTEDEGAEWYNEMAIKLHGEFARLNYISEAA